MNTDDIAKIERYRRFLRPDWRRWLPGELERGLTPEQIKAQRHDFMLRDRAFETPLGRRLREEKEEREREKQAALEAKHQAEIEREALKLKADLAWERFKAAFMRGDFAPSAKANFNPDQPRDELGRWTDAGIGHNQGPPLDDLPKIPKQPPPKSKERISVVKQVAKWLAGAAIRVATRHPVGLATVAAVTGAAWLYNQYNAHIEAYQDAPKNLEDLQSAVASPRAGYDTHHIVEKTSAARYGFDGSKIDSQDNLALIPRMKHWEINGWYATRNEDYGGLSPRDYLRDKDWDERRRVGLDAMIKFKVLKP